jgi:hypothetical protein
MENNKQAQPNGLILIEANTLFNEVTLNLPEAIYLAGDTVSILIDPCPAENPDQFHVPVTVVPLGRTPNYFCGRPITLQKAQDQQEIIYYGQLNQRGQATFQNLAAGSYRPQLPIAAEPYPELSQLSQESQAAIADLLLPIPLRLEKQNLPGRFRNAEGSLWTALFLRESGQLALIFETPERDWAGSVLGLIWIPLTAPKIEAQPRLRFALLAWNESDQLCRAELDLGPMPAQSQLYLPRTVWPLTVLTAEMAGAIQASLAGSVGPNVSQDWQKLFEQRPELRLEESGPAETARLPANRLPVWESVATAGRQALRLFTEIPVLIGSDLARFGRLPAPLFASEITLPALRAKSGGSISTQLGQALPLSAREQGIALSLRIGPIAADKAALAIQVETLLTQRPLPRARVTICDTNQQPLESDLTGEDGLVTFQSIEAGRYIIKVSFKDKVLELPVTFTPVAET